MKTIYTVHLEEKHPGSSKFRIAMFSNDEDARSMAYKLESDTNIISIRHEIVYDSFEELCEYKQIEENAQS